MPIYSYKCTTPGCEERFDRFLPLAQYQEEQNCPGCLQPAVKVLSPCRVIGDYPAYNCPITGKLIDGRKAHNENLRRNGCRLLEPGETREFQNGLKRKDQKFDADLDHTVEKFIDHLPAEKKDKLMAEAEAGLTLTIDRR